MRSRRLTAQAHGNLPSAQMRAPDTASLPRVPAGASSLVVQPGAALPLVGAFDPPIAPVQRPPPAGPDGIVGDRELVLQRVFLPNSSTVLVYTTQKRWRGIDVYIAPGDTGFAANVVVSIGVFAIVAGVRTLVGSGGVRGTDLTTFGACRAVAVRAAIAERFEVVLGFDGLPLTQQDNVNVSLIATDEALAAPDNDGVLTFTGTKHVLSGAAAVAVGGTSFPPTLVYVAAVTTTAARFLHVHDVASVVPGTLNGRAPVFEYGLPLIGSGVAVEFQALRTRKLFPQGFAVCGSTTAGVTTLPAAGQVTIGGLWR